MRIETTRFGPLKVNREDIIYFPEGLLGFPENTRFVFIDLEDRPSFRWLQAIDNPELAFVVLKPEKFLWSYAL
ncbi:MAG: flagellar assembly protein FliW, partial [Firmicutes bacterium]|nr:flagellar assembly protein FliW [Bacillota bacterium]